MNNMINNTASSTAMKENLVKEPIKSIADDTGKSLMNMSETIHKLESLATEICGPVEEPMNKTLPSKEPDCFRDVLEEQRRVIRTLYNRLEFVSNRISETLG